MSRLHAALWLCCVVLAGSIRASGRTYTYQCASGIREISISPHEPLIVVGSVNDLRAHWPEVKELLPKVPFRFGDEWICPAAAGAFRTYPVDPERWHRLSPNGEYVLFQEWDTSDRDYSQTKRLTLATTAGELLWSKTEGPYTNCTTNEGWVVGLSDPVSTPPRITFIDRSGTVVVEEQLPRSPGHDYRMRLLELTNEILVWQERAIALYAGNGRRLWSRQSTLAGDERWIIAPSPGPIADPLGRGICVPLFEAGPSNSLQLLERATGEHRAWLWRQEKQRLPYVWSPGGSVAALRPVFGLGLIDWHSGKLLFWHQRPWTINGYAAEMGWGQAGASGNPPRLVVPLDGIHGVSVFDGVGRRTWWCIVRDSPLGCSISEDGTLVSIALYEGGTADVIDALLCFRVGSGN